MWLVVALYSSCVFLSILIYLKHNTDRNLIFGQASKNLSIALVQKNRTQIENIISGLKRISDVESVTLCQSDKVVLGGRLDKCHVSDFGKSIAVGDSFFLNVNFKNFLLTDFFYFSCIFLFLSFVISVIVVRNLKEHFWVDLILPLRDIGNPENKFTISEYATISSDLLESQRIKIEFEKQKALNEISKQVSHDIRSPLAALNYLIENLESINPDDRVLIKKSLSRINDIANDLLKEARAEIKSLDFILSKIVIAEQVKDIISEKSLEFKHHDTLGLSLQINPSVLTRKSIIDVKEFSRLISNLINNSAEAMEFKGNIWVHMTHENDLNIITIRDSGGGLPPEVLEKIGKESVSTKEKGNGLGLLHAMNVIKSLGSEMLLENEDNGLKVTIKLKSIPEAVEAVLIDNDELCRIMWERKAKNKGIKIITCDSPEHFTEIKQQISSETVIYLDSDLGNGLKGEDFAERLFHEGFSNLYMATGYGAEKFKDLNFLSGVISKTPPF